MQNPTNNQARFCPYDQLFIYYIEGKANTEQDSMGSDFIGNWVEDGFSFLFFSRPSGQRVDRLLCSQPHLTLLDHYTMAYDDWLGEKPVTCQIGRFTVSPPWDPADSFYLPSFGAFHILLDPGVVFGTGTHPTTKDCLEMLDMAVRRDKSSRVLDLGCGTGLLSLAAARLKCRKILALDFNELAVKTTLNNVRINGLDDRILTVRGFAEDMVSVDADLLVANIHYEVMEKIVQSPGFLKKRHFILSGLLKTQAVQLVELLSKLPVEIVERRSSQTDVWHTFYGRVLDCDTGC